MVCAQSGQQNQLQMSLILKSFTRILVLFVGITLVILGFSQETFAKMFRNAYVAFELPDGWNCTLETTEWVCRSQDPNSSREAIIIFTAKEVGPTDSFPIYEQTINSPRSLTTKSGANIQSQLIQKAKQVRINDSAWIDGMQKGSEIPNYYTRYLATIKERIAILVTFSAHRDHYAKYSNAFFNAINSLRVIASKGLLANPTMGGGGGAGPGIFSGGGGMGDGSMMGDIPRAKSSKGGGLTKILLALGGLLVAAGGYFYMKRK